MRASNKDSRLSKPIVVISLASIIIGVAIMIISVSVVTGFQEGIRDKVIGFGSHIQVTELFDNSSMESSPILIDQDFYPTIEEDEEKVRKIQIYAYKPAILQSSRDSLSQDLAAQTSSSGSEDILGVLFKGVDERYDWDFFSDKLVEGRIVNFDSANSEVLISQTVANLMGYKIGDEVDAFFIMDNGPKKRKFEVCGIYNTGFEEFDKKFMFTQIQHVQRLNNWGVKTNISILIDSCIDKKFVLKAFTTGGSGAYRHKWNGSDYFNDKDYILINGSLAEDIELISTDFELNVFGISQEEHSIADTAKAKIIITNPCECNETTLKEHPIEFVSENQIIMPFGEINIQNGKGTYDRYTGGFEIMLHNWDDLEQMDEIIDMNIPGELTTKKITDMHPDIFAWLNFLDVNILIIIILILVVSLINMITALLVMILDKSNMIGILKAIGASNKSIRKIFLINSIFLLSRGLFWGNILGIGIITLQYFTGFLSLNPEVYYLDTVPVKFNWFNILFINLLTIIICRLTLALPSRLITKIDPIKAIRFD